MEPRPRYRGGEAFVRGLVEAVPGAFEGKDLRAEYGYGLDYGSFEDNGLPSDGWLSTIALCDAVAWLGMNAIVADASTETSVVLPGGEALLRGLFDYIEQVLVEGAMIRTCTGSIVSSSTGRHGRRASSSCWGLARSGS